MEIKKHIFTPMEKKYFIEILKKYKAVVENKETDGASLRKKSETWNKIAAEYNASPHSSTQATTKQLRRLWMNIKQRQREALTKERQRRLATGGGPSISDATIHPEVSEVAPALIVVTDTVKSEREDDMVQPVEIEEVSEVVPHDPLTGTPTESSESRRTEPAGQRNRSYILESEYTDRQMRANEKHEVELQILQEQLREAKAKADLAELILRHRQQCSSDT